MASIVARRRRFFRGCVVWLDSCFGDADVKPLNSSPTCNLIGPEVQMATGDIEHVGQPTENLCQSAANKLIC